MKEYRLLIGIIFLLIGSVAVVGIDTTIGVNCGDTSIVAMIIHNAAYVFLGCGFVYMTYDGK